MATGAAFLIQTSAEPRKRFRCSSSAAGGLLTEGSTAARLQPQSGQVRFSACRWKKRCSSECTDGARARPGAGASGAPSVRSITGAASSHQSSTCVMSSERWLVHSSVDEVAAHCTHANVRRSRVPSAARTTYSSSSRTSGLSTAAAAAAACASGLAQSRAFSPSASSVSSSSSSLQS
ncbi:hypothetical protein T492DRAFT_1086925 [Pavlovales sp. CCMP2436]|nr:hypothetical protein T492DRAFT_1086925 [Pavlovales sp. CCMP2436]